MDLYVIGDSFHHHNHVILHNANMRFWWWLGISNYDVYHSENKRKSFFFCDGVVMACTLNSSVFHCICSFNVKEESWIKEDQMIIILLSLYFSNLSCFMFYHLIYYLLYYLLKVLHFVDTSLKYKNKTT